jgi:hypothetical protein
LSFQRKRKKHPLDDLFMCLEPVANAVLATVDVDDILHARLDP